MTDVERDLHDMLHRTADNLNHAPRPNRGLVRRARLRRARTGAITGVAVVALAIGGFAGARSLSSDEPVPPATPDKKETKESSGGMWPQSSMEEARLAQRLADEGDPRYAWQVWPDVFPMQPGQMDPLAVEFFNRFLQEKLGWEEFVFGPAPGWYAGVSYDWPWEFVAVRCAPGQANTLYPNDEVGRGCAPTLDDLRYETVKITADQAVRVWEDPDGPSGIWVVTRWAMLQPSDAPAAGTQHFVERQVQQVAPPSEAEATAFVSDFLQARMDGEGAEEYLATPAEAPTPLMYATTSEAPYERFELELVKGPVWPGGWMEFKVRLFAEGGETVVEQPFIVERLQDGGLTLVHGTVEDGVVPTTENGEPLAEPYRILDGEVTFGVQPPWYGFFDYGQDTIALTQPDLNYNLAVLPDPLPVDMGCRPSPRPADAESLAQSLQSDPDLETTTPVPATVGEIQGLRMDVATADGASVCRYMGTPLVLGAADPRGPRGPGLEGADRMSLYLLDLPEGSSARTLAIAFVAPEPSFETMLEAAAPILETFEFRAR